MSDNTVIEHCSPTLAGIKTGSLFSFEYEDADEARGHIKRLNGIFVRKGLRAFKKCTEDYKARMDRGATLEGLIVALAD